MKTVTDYYRNRFPDDEHKQRNEMWKILCTNYFQQYIKKDDVVMDIAAGYCEFINNIKCRARIAVDINPDVRKHANKNIKVVLSPATKIPTSYNGKVDKIFMSNFLEHLSTKEEVIETLERANQLLKKGGKLMVLQPNISLVGNRYWNFIDHKVALNFQSMVEVLNIAGFQIEQGVERFLPYTTKGNLPSWPFIIKLYLFLPQFLRPFAGQSFFVANKK